MCGIFGYISKNKIRFDHSSFNLLGICNDTRGGDSCGVFIDRKCEIGVGNNKWYKDFARNSKIVKNTELAQIAIGHCRKASVGLINELTAQPVVIKNKKTKRPEFAVIHNGTIINYKELANKYLKNWDKSWTDSYVMTHIFYHHGYEVLNEYIGAAVFVIIDYRKDSEDPDVFLFKGNSKFNINATEPIDERPFYGIFGKYTLWFSSIKESLELINPKEQVLTINPNIVYHYKDNKLYIHKKIDRSKMYQTEVVVYNDISSYYSSFPKYLHRNYKPEELLETYDILKTLCDSKPSGSYKLYYDPIGLFYNGTSTAHGKYKVSRYGVISKEHETFPCVTLWFFRGYLVAGKDSYKILDKVYDIILDKYSGAQFTKAITLLESILIDYSPVPMFDLATNSFWVKAPFSSELDSMPYTGDFSILFNLQHTHLKIKDGLITEVKTESLDDYSRKLFKLEKTANEGFYNIEGEIDSCVKQIENLMMGYE